MAARELIEPAGFERIAFPAMGTSVTVLLPADSIDRAQGVRSLFEEWEAALSRFRPESELSRLNAAAGREARVGALLFEVVSASMDAARATDGLFDPLLGARMVELGYDDTFARLPADRPARPFAAWRPGAWRSVRTDAHVRTVSLPEGTAFDVGGIAKGMAVDAAVRLLASSGVTAAAVNAGGDLAVLGCPADAAAWTIGIDAPGDGAGPLVALASGALATSSLGRRRWTVGGEVRHHLLDPRDGLPMRTDAWSVSVVASSCRVAEVAAKVALVLGLDQGPAFLRAHGLSGVVIDQNGSAFEVTPARPMAGAASGSAASRRSAAASLLAPDATAQAAAGVTR